MNDQLRQRVQAMYAHNARRHGSRRYTVPSADAYPYQWLWDSCFHAITLSYFDIDRAKEEIELLVSSQLRHGMFPHIIYRQRIEETTFPSIAWGLKQTSSLTQPPMIAAAVWRIYEESGDSEWVKQQLPHIHAFHRYLFAERDPLHLNLAAIVNPDESGEDNSPRFDSILGFSSPHHRFSENFQARLELVSEWRESHFVIKDSFDAEHWVYDIGFNSILSASLQFTAKLATVADNPYILHYSQHRARAVEQAIHTHLRYRGAFRSKYGPSLKPLDVETWATFLPLYAGIVSATEAQRLVDTLFSNPARYRTPYRLPTVPLDEPSFDANSDWTINGTGANWRGPVWIGANWFVIQGLLRYGFRREARALHEDSVRLVTQSGFREYYDPLTGEGHGAEEFTWGGLVLDTEALLGSLNKKSAAVATDSA